MHDRGAGDGRIDVVMMRIGSIRELMLWSMVGEAMPLY